MNSSSCARRGPLTPGRRLICFLVGALLWTFLSCYPNPLAFLRSAARLSHLPTDPHLAERMGWQTPDRAEDLPVFVDGLLLPAADWQIYRVPWYLATPGEAVRVGAGDEEARALILASLLQEKGIPFQVCVSPRGMWVQYPGGGSAAGGTDGEAWLVYQDGRLRLHRPRRAPWGEMFAAIWRRCWTTAPPVRRATWIFGLIWVLLLALVVGHARPRGTYLSHWRVPLRSFLLRVLSLTTLTTLVIALAATALPSTKRWTYVEMNEAIGYAAVLGGLLAWLSVLRPRTAVSISPDDSEIAIQSVLGPLRWERRVPAEDLSHLLLEASAGGLRPWTLFAVTKGGRRVLLLRENSELSARGALRTLGARLHVPIIVRSDGVETRTAPEDIGRSLVERAAAPPPVPSPPPLTSLRVTESEDRWQIGYPPPDREVGKTLIGCAAVPVLAVMLSTWLLAVRPDSTVIRLLWVCAIVVLSLIAYLAISLRGEIISRLGQTRVEIAGGELRFHSARGKVETIPLANIESVEPARTGEMPAITIVSPHRLVHMPGLGLLEDRAWVISALKNAIVRFA